MCQVLALGHLTVMFYLYNLYNVKKISICIVKSFGQISSPSRVKTQETCVLNLNEAYTSHVGDDMDLGFSDDAFDREDDTYHPLDSQQTINLIERRSRPSRIYLKQ